MGQVEQPGDVARVWYALQDEDGQRKRDYWYFATVLEARVIRDRLLNDPATAGVAVEVKHDDTWLEYPA